MTSAKLVAVIAALSLFIGLAVFLVLRDSDGFSRTRSHSSSSGAVVATICAAGAAAAARRRRNRKP